MSVANGQKANETTFNTSFVSKEDDSTVVSKVTLNRTGSGAQVDDVQQDINTNKTDIATNRADIDSNDVELADHESRITTNEGDITSIQNDLATDTMDLSTNQTAAGEKTFSNNVTINADLNVTGTIASVNDLEVDDNVITVNKNGNDASSEGAGLDVERTGTNGTFAYKNTLDNKWEIGEVGNLQEVSGIVKDTLANLQALVSPSSSNLYFATDTLEHFRSDGTDLQPLGSGGGGGGLDNWLSEDFEITVAADFSTGNNATFLGAGTLDGALSDETTNPLSGDSSLKYVAGSSSLNDYFASPVIDVDPKQQENDSGFTFYFTWDGTTDIECVIWDETNSVKLNSVLDVINTADGATRYSTSFYPPSTCTQVRYGFHILEAPTNGDILIVDDVEFSTNPFVYKDLIEYQSGNITQAGTAMTDRNVPRFNLSGFTTQGANILTVEDNATYGTRFIANRDCAVTLNWCCFQANPSVVWRDVDGVTLLGTLGSSTVVGAGVNDQAQASGTVDLKTGQSIGIRIGSTDIANNSQLNTMSFSAEVSTSHVVTPAKSQTETAIYDTHAGFGSTAVRIPYFTNTIIDTFSDILTANNNSTNGLNFVAKEKCIVTASFTGAGTSLSRLGWSINADGTNQLTSLSSANRLAIVTGDSANEEATATISIVMEKGDVLKPHCDTFSAAVALRWHLTITATKFDVSFLAAVPVQKVAVVEQRGGGTRQTMTTGYATLGLNTLVDSGGFASLNSDQVTIPAGEYKIETTSYFYWTGGGGGSIYTKLVDVTNTVDRFNIPVFANSNAYLNTKTTHKITLTEQATFEVQGLITGGPATYYGDNIAAPNDLQGQLIITKLR